MNNDEFIGKLYTELKENSKSLVELKVISARQEENLREHMRRTEILENMHTTFTEKVEKELEPIQKHVGHVETAVKFLGIISLIVGIGSGLVRIIQYFF